MHVDGPEGFPDSGDAFSDLLLTLGGLSSSPQRQARL